MSILRDKKRRVRMSSDQMGLIGTAMWMFGSDQMKKNNPDSSSPIKLKKDEVLLPYLMDNSIVDGMKDFNGNLPLIMKKQTSPDSSNLKVTLAIPESLDTTINRNSTKKVNLMNLVTEDNSAIKISEKNSNVNYTEGIEGAKKDLHVETYDEMDKILPLYLRYPDKKTSTKHKYQKPSADQIFPKSDWKRVLDTYKSNFSSDLSRSGETSDLSSKDMNIQDPDPIEPTSGQKAAKLKKEKSKSKGSPDNLSPQRSPYLNAVTNAIVREKRKSMIEKPTEIQLTKKFKHSLSNPIFLNQGIPPPSGKNSFLAPVSFGKMSGLQIDRKSIGTILEDENDINTMFTMVGGINQKNSNRGS